jgi:hypothetical protein
MNPTSKNLLNDVPDWTDWRAAEKWLAEGKREAKALCGNETARAVKWEEFRAKTQSSFGNYSNPIWRKFVLAIFLADLVSYPKPVDQVTFDHLALVMQKFPEGFTLWFLRGKHGWWPAGYSAWVPVHKTQFDQFLNTPHHLKDRLVSPIAGKVTHPWVYLFNYSVAPSVKGSPLSRALMMDYSAKLLSLKAKGFAAVTVSEDGARIAKRFGMKKTGYLTIQNTREAVYCSPAK